MNWVQPKFSDFVVPVQPKKRKRTDDDKTCNRSKTRNIKETKQDLDPTSWANRFAPKKRSDLIVNKKKVEELEAWLRRPELSVLLVTGPSGCGKLTTLRVLCKDLGFGVSEWITPESKAFEPGQVDELYVSQSRAFEEFVLRAARYTSLLAPTSNRIVLVKDIPPTFVRDPASFHTFLERCTNGTKVAFILSDSALTSNLFPDEVRMRCGVTSVAFNAVTKRALASYLTDVVRKEAPYSEARSLAASVAEAVDGDVRHGLAALQFYVTGTGNIPSTLMDPNIDLFRGIGRALYAKRDNKGKLVYLPEDVAASCPPSALMGLLQENYTSTVSDLDTAVAASEGLALADLLTAHSGLTDFATDIATRTVMVVNKAPVRKFQAFARAKSGPVSLLCSELRASVAAGFSSSDVTTIMADSTFLRHLANGLTPPQREVISRLSSYNLVDNLRR